MIKHIWDLDTSDVQTELIKLAGPLGYNVLYCNVWGIYIGEVQTELGLSLVVT